MGMDILIVDDEGNIRRSLRALLEAEGHHVGEAGSAEEALRILAIPPTPDVVLLDLALPGASGLQALPLMQEAAPAAAIVMMSGQASLSDAVEATRLGAFHFIEKPLSPEAILLTVRGAGEVARARDLTRALRAELGPEVELVGESPAMAEVRQHIRKVAPTQARVLITGESGTGKELAAAAIHGLSDRRRGPFIRVNSAAIPRDLVESEMFGHEKGAFTGATERRRGRFELADGGTLFLDEVADLGLEAQAKLLRVLEAGVVERVGGQRGIPVDVRVVAATNRELREEVAEGRFREDLLFRLEVVPLRMPPLRERGDDVRLLVAHATHRLQARHGLPPARFTPEALAAFRRYHWPGNVRELLNVVERLTILHAGEEVEESDVQRVLLGGGRSPLPTGFDPGDDRPLRARLDEYERTLLEGALRHAEGNVAEAARLLQTDRANLYRRLRRLGVLDTDH